VVKGGHLISLFNVLPNTLGQVNALSVDLTFFSLFPLPASQFPFPYFLFYFPDGRRWPKTVNGQRCSCCCCHAPQKSARKCCCCCCCRCTFFTINSRNQTIQVANTENANVNWKICATTSNMSVKKKERGNNGGRRAYTHTQLTHTQRHKHSTLHTWACAEHWNVSIYAPKTMLRQPHERAVTKGSSVSRRKQEKEWW